MVCQDLLKRAKKQEEDMRWGHSILFCFGLLYTSTQMFLIVEFLFFVRRGIKWFSRGAKAVEWACYLCVSVTVATAVRVGKP
jgi:hypothetical protein